MAREQRKDVDYFPHECSHGRKMHIIEDKYGNDGYATWFKVLEQLGKANNHYIDASDDSSMMYLASVCKVNEDRMKSILNDLSKLGAIDRYLYENYQVIFSQKFTESIADAYRKRKTKMFEYGDVLALFESKTGHSPAETPQSDADCRKLSVKKSREENSKEDKYIYTSEFSEDDFIKIWSRARMHYDKSKTGFEKLQPMERQNFKTLSSEFSPKQFEQAVAGLFFQDTLPAVRVRPDHFLKPENFTKYLDCWINQKKMFDSKPKEQTVKTSRFQKGDV